MTLPVGSRRSDSVPRGLVETAAAVLWGESPPGGGEAFAEHSFIGLGGDSLRAMHLAAVALDRHDVVVPVETLMGGQPLVEVLAAATPAERSVAPGADEDDSAANGTASAIQQGMWAAERLIGGAPYNLVFTAFLTGRLREDLLERAVAGTVARHEGLRTVFPEEDGGLVRRVVEVDRPDFATVRHDGDDAGFATAVRAIAAEHGRRPLDPASAPALRFLLVRSAADRAALVMVVHHMLLDGWAIGLVLREILDRYAAYAAGGEPDLGPPARMEGLLRAQRRLRETGEWDRLGDFWERRLDGVPTLLDLPADRQRPQVQDPAGARHPFDAGPVATAAVVRRARELGITPFAFLLGAFALALRRYTGADRLLVGVLLAGRSSAELEELVAVAGNLLPVRVDVDDGRSVADYLRGVHRSVTDGVRHGALPFDEIVSRVGAGGGIDRHPLVQVSFGMHDQLVPRRLRTADLDVRVEEGHGGGSQFDLTLLIRDRDPAFAGDLEYATAVWTAAEAEAFLADYAAAVDGLASDPDRRLEDVRCIAGPRRSLLERLNDTARPYPATSVEELFRLRVAERPGAVAVREGNTRLSYAELAEAASVQARLLADAGVRPGDSVLVGLDRSVAEAVGLLGVLWAGGRYVGVDANLPAAVRDQIVDRVQPAAALEDPAAEPGRFGAVPLVETWHGSWNGRPGMEPAGPADPERVAYVAFTSGSTGVPKGVCVPHRGIVRLVHGVDYVRLGPDERVLRLSPLAFDASTLEVWGSLLTGAALEIHPAGLPSPGELGDFLVRRRVTVAWLTSGLFRLVAEFAPGSFAHLRQLLTGGDVVSPAHVAGLLARHPGLVVTNGYGPTENTTFTTTHTVRTAAEVEDPLPIGRPVPNTRVYVLDNRWRLLPPGAVGDLFAAGDGLAAGYLGDEAETARAFGSPSPDVAERLYRTGDLVRLDTRGRLQFLGRRDEQVKLRGYRVELGEIRAALCAHPSVQDAVVVVTGSGSADKRLLAGCVPAGVAPDLGELQNFLAGRLPGYMVPSLWAVLDQVPITRNGKLDRRALEAVARPAAGGTNQAAAGTAGGRVRELVAEVLGRDDVGADEDFFAAGGDSLRAIRLVGLIHDELGADVPLRDFLRNPTSAALARLVDPPTPDPPTGGPSTMPSSSAPSSGAASSPHRSTSP